MSASLAVCALFVSAQTQEEVTETVFAPHWYGLVQIGGQETLGEASFGKLFSFNAQLGAGYQFNPVLGARFTLNGWTSKGALDFEGKHYWKYNYISPMVDVTVDLVNLIAGYSPERKWTVGALAGIGANIAFKNDQANDVNNSLKQYVGGENALGNIWDGTKTRLTGRLGVNFDYAVTEQLKLGVELQANVLNDNYNSKIAHNADWYFNGLVGVKYAFGPTTAKRTRYIDVAPCEPQIIEKVVEKIIEKEVPVPVVEEKAPEQFRRDIFFTISNTRIDNSQMAKIDEIVSYINNHPNCKVEITGYADKGTGSQRLNLRLSMQRAQAVANALAKKGIPQARVVVKSMGEEMYQPYADPVLNRVAICIAED